MCQILSTLLPLVTQATKLDFDRIKIFGVVLNHARVMSTCPIKGEKGAYTSFQKIFRASASKEKISRLVIFCHCKLWQQFTLVKIWSALKNWRAATVAEIEL